MKKRLDEQEVIRILNLHKNEKSKKGLFLEQSSDVKTQLQQLVDGGCIENGKVVELNSTNPNRRFAIKKESVKNPGKFNYFFIDFTYGSYDENNKFSFGDGKWDCSHIQNAQLEKTKQEAQSTTKIATQKPLNNNQLKVLELLKPLGWFHTPAPTDVEVDDGLYKKLDLVKDTDDSLSLKYSKYFINDFPEGGFFIYKKQNVGPTNAPGNVQKIEITAEACKVAIESLWNNLTSPNTYPITNDEINSYRKTAQICAEPANSNKFLMRFGLKNKLKDLSKSKFGIKIY